MAPGALSRWPAVLAGALLLLAFVMAVGVAVIGPEVRRFARGKLANDGAIVVDTRRAADALEVLAGSPRLTQRGPMHRHRLSPADQRFLDDLIRTTDADARRRAGGPPPSPPPLCETMADCTRWEPGP